MQIHKLYTSLDAWHKEVIRPSIIPKCTGYESKISSSKKCQHYAWCSRYSIMPKIMPTEEELLTSGTIAKINYRSCEKNNRHWRYGEIRLTNLHNLLGYQWRVYNYSWILLAFWQWHCERTTRHFLRSSAKHLYFPPEAGFNWLGDNRLAGLMDFSTQLFKWLFLSPKWNMHYFS